ATQEWQMFDLVSDPQEMKSVYDDPRYAKTREELTAEYHRLRKYYDAPSYEKYAPKHRRPNN
ncbi:MAG: DUF4976 domain-containing protein, partial [Verrucomicrobiae bacterium]|nr:DUF4976 domain-containing protein [Verrucomicrobiae bacterium]NNJ87128.1 DUF4976 domain-containing protein [Akkermansiaceae bacterium]